MGRVEGDHIKRLITLTSANIKRLSLYIQCTLQLFFRFYNSITPMPGSSSLSDKYPTACRLFLWDTFPTPETISSFVELLVGEKLGTFSEHFVYFSHFHSSFSNVSDVKIVLRYPSIR
jgi:hypothetical protein